MPKKFYLTTPIYYVNARPHIGHAYTTIAADVLARRHRLLGDDVFFLTGTDEHGQKIERSAAAAGVPPQQFADEVAASFAALWQRMGITHNKFIRTTDPEHKRGVQKLFRTLQETGAIYLDSYTGAYCVSDETFVDLPAGTPCPDCGRPLEIVTEENFFFDLKSYQEKLIYLIESDDPDAPLRIEPESRRNEVLGFLRGNYAAEITETYDRDWATPESSVSTELAAKSKSDPIKIAEEEGRIKKSAAGHFYVPGALKDLSISRTSFKWGIPVPDNEKHVIYVWLDALVNYITAVGYGSDAPEDVASFEKYWPADLHLVGKEIIRFHCVYWPAFLLAAGLKLPKKIQAHGWLLFEESKMSKSRGNIVRTETILDAFGDHYRASLAAHNKKLAADQEKLRDAANAEKKNKAVILSEGASAPESKDLRVADVATTARPFLTEQPSFVPEPTKEDCDLFAADVLRYFLLREIPFGQDGSFSFDALITRYNADLANGYGNLVSRTLSMIEQYFGGQMSSTWMQKELFAIGNNLLDDEGIDFNESKLTGSIKSLASYIAALDRNISERAPWKLAKQTDDESRSDLEAVLYQAAESIRIITALLHPVMPHTTAKVWAQLGLGDIEAAARNGELKDLKWGGLKPGTKLGPLAPIFPRAPKELAQVMSDIEAQSNPAKPAAETLASPNPSTASAAPSEKSFQSVSSVLSSSPEAVTSSPQSPLISIDDFSKIDLRVARVLVAERIPKADKLLRLEVDLGPNFDPPTRQILAGIAQFYSPEKLIGRKVVIVANLAPRKMRGLESQGMVVAASIEPDGAPALASFLEDVEIGARLK